MISNLLQVNLANGETLAYRKVGSGPKVLILVHGNMSASGSWDLLLENLPQDDFTVYAPDLRGFGKSTYINPINSLKDFSDDLKLFAEQLNLEKFSIVGWSTGGGVAMELAAQHPEIVEKLILISSVGIKGYTLLKKNIFGLPKFGQIVKTKEEILKEVTTLLKAQGKNNTFLLKFILNKSMFNVNKPEPERLNSYVQDMLDQRNLVDVNYALITFNASHEPNYIVEGSGIISKIKAPTLIIQGEQDKIVHPDEAKRTAQAIGEKAKLVMYPKCGHSPLVDNLNEVTEEIIAFINSSAKF